LSLAEERQRALNQGGVNDIERLMSVEAFNVFRGSPGIHNLAIAFCDTHLRFQFVEEFFFAIGIITTLRGNHWINLQKKRAVGDNRPLIEKRNPTAVFFAALVRQGGVVVAIRNHDLATCECWSNLPLHVVRSICGKEKAECGGVGWRVFTGEDLSQEFANWVVGWLAGAMGFDATLDERRSETLGVSRRASAVNALND
jgi:hypothetical protein